MVTAEEVKRVHELAQQLNDEGRSRLSGLSTEEWHTFSTMCVYAAMGQIAREFRANHEAKVNNVVPGPKVKKKAAAKR